MCFRSSNILQFFQNKGFSLIELLVTVAIAGTLAVIGIKSYQAQTNKTRSATAKHSLSYVWQAENNFKETWGTYHENLMLIGAVPAGVYHYDVGFDSKASLSKTEGNLERHPLPESLDVSSCTNFYRICNPKTTKTTTNKCLSDIKTAVGKADSDKYFGSDDTTTTCSITGCTIGTNCVEDYSFTTAEAQKNSFKAFAIGKLKSVDVWSIDQEKIVIHEKDGTE